MIRVKKTSYIVSFFVLAVSVIFSSHYFVFANTEDGVGEITQTSGESSTSSQETPLVDIDSDATPQEAPSDSLSLESEASETSTSQDGEIINPVQTDTSTTPEQSQNLDTEADATTTSSHTNDIDTSSISTQEHEGDGAGDINTDLIDIPQDQVIPVEDTPQEEIEEIPLESEVEEELDTTVYEDISAYQEYIASLPKISVYPDHGEMYSGETKSCPFKNNIILSSKNNFSFSLEGFEKNKAFEHISLDGFSIKYKKELLTRKETDNLFFQFKPDKKIGHGSLSIPFIFIHNDTYVQCSVAIIGGE